MDPPNNQPMMGDSTIARDDTVPLTITPTRTRSSSEKSRGAFLDALRNTSWSKKLLASRSKEDDSMRMRRGYRPLSVLTPSVLMPFEFDPDRVMEDMKSAEEMEELERDPKVDNIVEEIEEDALATTAQSEGTAQHHESLPSPVSPSKLDRPKSSTGRSELSLKTFLAQTSPEGSQQSAIHASFSTLCRLPEPDISQHPAFSSSSPFESRSDAPNLVCVSTPEQIRQFSKEISGISAHQTSETSESSDAFGSSGRKTLGFSDQRYNPHTPGWAGMTPSLEISPLAKRRPNLNPTEDPSTGTKNTGENEDHDRIPSGRLRKISTMFKSKSNTETVDTPSAATPSEIHSPNSVNRSLEEYLRTVSYSPTYDYSEGSWYPRHPNTGRAWKSRNLKCTTCLDVCCACCGRTCCAYKAAVMALETHKYNPPGQAAASERIEQITKLFPYGKEAPTFLQCTKDVVDGKGCGKMVCPDCCGICPDEACRDTQCRRCKKNPWAECDWHAPTTDLARMIDSRVQRHTM